jgi:hypothetical protein
VAGVEVAPADGVGRLDAVPGATQRGDSARPDEKAAALFEHGTDFGVAGADGGGVDAVAQGVSVAARRAAFGL